VGQARLLALYQSAFAVHGLMTAQVLLTCADLKAERKTFLRATFERLLASGVVPVVNENDAVTLGVEVPGPTRTFQDRVFRDNDGLAAHVAAGCEADLLLLLTDVDGVCARDPRLFPGEPVLDRVDDAETLLSQLVKGREETATVQGLSRGGMHSKVAAAQLATRGRCHVVIASGNPSGTIESMVAGHAVGTFFPSQSFQQETV
jgi:glutamate 5-kinase